MPPIRFSPEALTGITGSARGAGPWTRHASKYRLNPSGKMAGMCAASGYEKYWFSRLIRMMRQGKPVPGTHWLFWYRPRQTPVAPFQSRSKSETLTAVPAFGFHHRSAVGSVGGNFVYWIVSRISPVNLRGGGRI